MKYKFYRQMRLKEQTWTHKLRPQKDILEISEGVLIIPW